MLKVHNKNPREFPDIKDSTTKIFVTLYGYTRLKGYLFTFFFFLLFFRIWRPEHFFIYLLGDVGQDIYF
jgi:hypothetical protein